MLQLPLVTVHQEAAQLWGCCYHPRPILGIPEMRCHVGPALFPTPPPKRSHRALALSPTSLESTTFRCQVQRVGLQARG